MLIIHINPLPADHDNNRFRSVLFDQTTFIGSEMTVYTSGFKNVWSENKQIYE